MRTLLSSGLLLCLEAVVPIYDFRGFRSSLLEGGLQGPLQQPAPQGSTGAVPTVTLPAGSAPVGSTGTGVLLPARPGQQQIIQDEHSVTEQKKLEQQQRAQGPAAQLEQQQVAQANSVLSTATQQQLATQTKEVTMHEGRYYILPYVEKQSDCESFNWAWGFRWGYVALHVGPTAPYDELSFTEDYEVVKNDPAAHWVNCAYITGAGPYTAYYSYSAVDNELKADFKPLKDHQESIDKCKEERNDGSGGPVKVCVVPAIVFVVYEYVAIVLLGLIWVAFCRNRQRVVSPNVVDCEVGGGRLCGNDTESIEGFKNVGFCNCVGNCFCFLCICAKGGMWSGLRAIGTALECCFCWECVWAETVSKRAVYSAVAAYTFVVVYILAIPILVYAVVYIPYYIGYVIPGLLYILFIVMRCLARPKIRGDDMVNGFDLIAHGVTVCWPHCFYCCCAIFQEAEYVELRGEKMLEFLDGASSADGESNKNWGPRHSEDLQEVVPSQW